MKSKKFLWFMLRLNLIVWLAAAAIAIWLTGTEAAPEREELCHFGETKEVPSGAVAGHLAHGDYLGVCIAPTPESTPDPTPEPTPEPSPEPTPAHKRDVVRVGVIPMSHHPHPGRP